MKNLFRLTTASALLAAAAHAQSAPQQPPPAGSEDLRRTERREVVRVYRSDEGGAPPAGELPSAKPRIWLGVILQQVGPTLAAQLGLPEGTGLVVADIVPESPADKAGLQRHDVVSKFEDQIVIEPRQVQVLIQARKAGDEVKLTYFRGGKENVATVKLIERAGTTTRRHRAAWIGRGAEAPLAPGGPRAPLPPLPDIAPGEVPPAPPALGPDGKPPVTSTTREFRFESSGMPAEVMEQVMRAAGEAQDAAGGALEQAGRALRENRLMRNVTILDLGDSDVVLKDDDHTIELRGRNGQRDLTIKGRDGNELYAGPLNNEQDWAAVPEELRGKVREVEAQTRRAPEAPAVRRVRSQLSERPEEAL